MKLPNNLKVGNYLVPKYAIFSDKTINKNNLLMKDFKYRINSIEDLADGRIYSNEARVVITVETEFGIQAIKYYIFMLDKHFIFLSTQEVRRSKLEKLFE